MNGRLRCRVVQNLFMFRPNEPHETWVALISDSLVWLLDLDLPMY